MSNIHEQIERLKSELETMSSVSAQLEAAREDSSRIVLESSSILGELAKSSKALHGAVASDQEVLKGIEAEVDRILAEFTKNSIEQRNKILEGTKALENEITEAYKAGINQLDEAATRHSEAFSDAKALTEKLEPLVQKIQETNLAGKLEEVNGQLAEKIIVTENRLNEIILSSRQEVLSGATKSATELQGLISKNHGELEEAITGKIEEVNGQLAEKIIATENRLNGIIQSGRQELLSEATKSATELQGLIGRNHRELEEALTSFAQQIWEGIEAQEANRVEFVEKLQKDTKRNFFLLCACGGLSLLIFLIVVISLFL